MCSPKDFRPRIVALIRLRAAGHFSFPRRPFLRIGMMAVPPRSDNCGVTLPGVEGAAADHRADRFIGRDLIQQIRQHKAVAFAA